MALKPVRMIDVRKVLEAFRAEVRDKNEAGRDPRNSELADQLYAQARAIEYFGNELVIGMLDGKFDVEGVE